MRHGDDVRISNEQEIQNMLGYTKIQIMGNLGGTPEMKFLPSGDPVVNFSVAVNRRYKDREGNQKDASRCGSTIQSRTARRFPSRSSPAPCVSWVPVAVTEPSVRHQASRPPGRLRGRTALMAPMKTCRFEPCHSKLARGR